MTTIATLKTVRMTGTGLKEIYYEKTYKSCHTISASDRSSITIQETIRIATGRYTLQIVVITLRRANQAQVIVAEYKNQ